MNRNILSVSLLLILSTLLVFSCKKDDEPSPNNNSANTAALEAEALIKATDETSITLSDDISIEDGETTDWMISLDYPDEFDANLNSELLSGVKLEFSPALSAGAKIEQFVDGSPTGNVYTASGETEIWLNDAFGISRTTLKDQSDISYSFRTSDLEAGSYKITATVLAAATDAFDDVDQRTELGNDILNIAVNEIQYDLIKINTDFGKIYMWLYDQTPLHRDNFLELTEDAFYDGLLFHRVVNDFVIQGGDPAGNGSGGPGYTIDAEFVPELTHVYGAVGAARLPDNVNPQKASSGSQFYIVEGQAGAHFLDDNYTVFGMIIGGMDIVSTIAEVPVDGNDKPINNVVMNKVTIEKYTAAQLLADFNFEVPQ